MLWYTYYVHMYMYIVRDTKVYQLYVLLRLWYQDGSFHLSVVTLSRAFVAATDLTADDDFTLVIHNSPHADAWRGKMSSQ